MSLRKLTNDTADDFRFFPEDRIGPFLPISEEDIDIFNDILNEEIDSVFASTICCCDFCYDDFKRHWPEVPFRKIEFQTKSIESWWFLESSRVIDLYTAAEISTLRHCVCCSRCNRFDSWNLWLYEHRFSGADTVEKAIGELLELGSKTPFLMLEHPFAKSVLEQIRTLATVATRKQLDMRLYRARLAADIIKLAQNKDELSTYAPPPAASVGEGRFNHAGHPMLYVASSPAVAAAELGRPGDLCNVAELYIAAELKILELIDFDENAPGYELLEALASSALLLEPRTGEGWMKPQYVFSRFVADCAISAGFNAIRFGSTKRVIGNNIVILDPPLDFSTFATLRNTVEQVCEKPDHRY
ncbi:RES family NAD+ phosphorylase [Paracoccus lutimaris]|uniref:RES domain-containing protein n=1 Tax=Paracoccus lutimaris TaxID=1490030 RepID=A0A368Z0Q4_9RHOB|nr:RES family NAD+ phosphorylase [Paracoccus lutimaris]RCW85056.1 RES domain-containing protein [Paracoccus lutimaris]